MVRVTQPGTTRRDVKHAFEFAAAHSTQRATEWSDIAAASSAKPPSPDSLELDNSHPISVEQPIITNTLGVEDEVVVGMGEDGKVTDGDLDSDHTPAGTSCDANADIDDESAAYISDDSSNADVEGQDWMTSLAPYGGVVHQPVGFMLLKTVRFPLHRRVATIAFCGGTVVFSNGSLCIITSRMLSFQRRLALTLGC